jgi:hypothetical protein
MKTPVAFIIFRRPDTTAKVFERIRKARPERLYIIADGPRSTRPGEAEAVAATRAIVSDAAIDWPCTVTRLYADANMGCRKRIVSGLNAVFEAEGKAIILEDDCLPHPDFFRFCEEALTRFEAHRQIGQIGGLNVLWDRIRFADDAWFSRYALPWGWATWANRWQEWSTGLELWDAWLNNPSANRCFSDSEREFWNGIYTRLKQPDCPWDTWSYPWELTHFVNHWLCLIPARNLIQNIGFDTAGTHTFEANPSLTPPLKRMPPQLSFPKTIEAHAKADELTFRTYFYYEEARFSRRLINQIRIKLGQWRKKYSPI